MAESSNSDANTERELTMCDVLQEERELEEDANAVLGGSDDTNCSYDQGYIPRQALYACSTCSKDAEPAGICLACCYACHDGHEVVELYTKRNFRCDCGNSKFSDKKCSLRPHKEPLNVENMYNQNFRGLYCSCSRPYPDPDDSIPDEMIQCIMCEDWYHGRHLGDKVPVNEDFGEMVCGTCMKSHSFMYTYLNHLCYAKINVTDIDENEGSSVNVKVKAQAQANENISSDVKGEEAQTVVQTDLKSTGEHSDLKNQIENGLTHSVQKHNEPTKVKLEDGQCFLKSFKAENLVKETGPAFWPEHWRKELCQCKDCMAMYKNLKCEYLLNSDDTIQAYEERGKSSGSQSQYDKGLSALSQLDRVKQMEAVRAYTNMKGKLKEYLKEFADNKRTVCESDIKEFFEQMSKRQRTGNGVPHFCR